MLTLDLTPSDRVRHVAMRGRLDAHTVPAAADAIDGPGATVVDLAQVDFIDSAGLALLVRAHTRCSRDGRAFVIAATSQPVRIILELTGLASVLRADPDRAASLLAGETA